MNYLIITVILTILANPSIGKPQTMKSWCFMTDDGNEYNVELDNIFKPHGAVFTLFVNSSKFGQPGKLTKDELIALDKSGHEIGGHGEYHSFPYMLKDAIEIHNPSKNVVVIEFDSSGHLNIGKKFTLSIIPNTAINEFVSIANEALVEANVDLNFSVVDVDTGLFPVSYLRPCTLILMPNHFEKMEFIHGWTLQQLKSIVRRDKDAIENVLEHPITAFAYPFGVGTEVARHIVKLAGYKYGRITQPGPASIRWSQQPTIYKDTDTVTGSWFVDGATIDNPADENYAIPITKDTRNKLIELTRIDDQSTLGQIELSTEISKIIKASPNKTLILDHRGTISERVYHELLTQLKRNNIAIINFSEIMSK